mgnify:CR=1 FL=1
MSSMKEAFMKLNVSKVKGNIDMMAWAQTSCKVLGPTPSYEDYGAHMDQLQRWYMEINHHDNARERDANMNARAFIHRLVGVMTTLVDPNFKVPPKS